MFNPTESRFTDLQEQMEYVVHGLKTSQAARQQALQSGLRSHALHSEDVTIAYHASLERLAGMIVLLAQDIENEASTEFRSRLSKMKRAKHPNASVDSLEGV